MKSKNGVINNPWTITIVGGLIVGIILLIIGNISQSNDSENSDNIINNLSQFEDSLNNNRYFNFSQTNVSDVKPIKKTMYSNSNHLICYKISNPTFVNQNLSFKTLGEWVDENGKPMGKPYEPILNSSEIFTKYRVNWNFIGNVLGQMTYNFKLRDDTDIEKSITYSVTDSKELSKFLENEYPLKWNNEMLEKLVSEVDLCYNISQNDYNIAEKVLLFTNNYMKKPFSRSDELIYDNNLKHIDEIWKNKEGSSSEYSYLYASLMRGIGIPSRIESFVLNKNIRYYYVMIYINNKWVPVDVYSKGLNECPERTYWNNNKCEMVPVIDMN